MPRVRIIKKNDEYSSEYDLGDIFEITRNLVRWCTH